jgi:ABC-2 type transport system ATP-binding protein
MVCDKVIIINQGRIAMQDSLENLRHNGGSMVEYYLEVAGPAAEVRRALSVVPGIRDLSEHTAHGGGEGILGYVFKVPRQGGAAEAVAGKMVQNKWGIREMKRMERTLEDIFVEVVGREATTEL